MKKKKSTCSKSGNVDSSVADRESSLAAAAAVDSRGKSFQDFS